MASYFPADSYYSYAYVALALVFLAVVCYPDRPIGVKARKGIKNITPAYPLVGNLPWIFSIITQRTRILDEVYRLQKEQAPGGKPFTLTFPALGGRVTVINNPAYLQHIQKVSHVSHLHHQTSPFLPPLDQL